MRYWCPTPLATERPAAQPSHLGRSASLVDKDQAFGIEVGLKLEPRPSSLQNVRPLLLACVRRFF
jgi:hypothetical protein